MPTLFPIDHHLERAAQLVLPSRIFFDIWFYFEGKDTRPAIIDTMQQFSEFFRFDPHAHFVAFVVHIAALFEKRGRTISLPGLAKEMEADVTCSIGPSMTQGATMRSCRSAARKVMVRQWPCGTYALSGTPRCHQP
jgi:hypothetical protein